MSNPFNPDDWKCQQHEVDPEGEARFHDAPNLPRCRVCWNLETVCRCARDEAYSDPAVEILKGIVHPSMGQAIAGIGEAERARLLSAYAARGVEQLEALVNGDE